MGWDYDYRVRRESEANPGSVLSDYLRRVTLQGETSAADDAAPYKVAGRDGETSPPGGLASGRLIVLQGVLRYTDAAGAVTHTNGAAGHAHENRGKVAELLADRGERTWLVRDDPNAGQVETSFKTLSPVSSNLAPSVFAYVLTGLDPYWREQTASHTGWNAGIGTFTLGGDAPTRDIVIDFTGGTDMELTDHDGRRIKVEGAQPAGGTRLDVRAGTLVEITGGADASDRIDASHLELFRWHPGSIDITKTGGGIISGTARRCWR